MNRWTKIILGACLVTALLTGATGLFQALPGRAETGRNATATATQAAAQLYAQGDYALAARAYAQLVDQGYGNVELYYNLGLAQYRTGDLPQALANLRQAARLAPRNGQVRAALAELAAAAPAAVPAQATGLLSKMAALSSRWLTHNELALLALGFWTLVAGGLLMGMLGRGEMQGREVESTKSGDHLS
jgi:tetratricopeptide (TPR) repeat protein